MKKQTAVEWLMERYLSQDYNLTIVDFDSANAMFEEQIIDAACEFMGTNFDPNKGRAELYYKGTYGGDK
jgi:hypothetical protein